MESSLYVAAAAQRNIQKQLTVVANNIANMNTAGFRSENVDFKNLVSRTAKEDVHFPTIAKLYPAMEQGALIQTDNPLDVAISGDGWFAISTGSGTAYTRDGRFQVTSFGELQTLEGFPVLDAGEAPIQLDTRSGSPNILQDGRIVSNGQTVGNLGVYDVPIENFFSRHSNSAFFSSVPGEPTALGDSNILNQGFIENSNVNPIKELANLITITKSFENATALIERVDQTLSKSISELGQR